MASQKILKLGYNFEYLEVLYISKFDRGPPKVLDTDIFTEVINIFKQIIMCIIDFEGPVQA